MAHDAEPQQAETLPLEDALHPVTPPPGDGTQHATGIESLNDIEKTLPNAQSSDTTGNTVFSEQTSINVNQHHHHLFQNLVDRPKAITTQSSDEVTGQNTTKSVDEIKGEPSSDEASDDTSDSESDSGAEEDSDEEDSDQEEADSEAKQESDEEVVEVTDLKAFAKQLMDDYAEEEAEWDEDGGGGETGPPRTFNEMLSQPLDIPEHDLTQVNITELGIVQFIMPGDASLTVLAKHDARRGVLNIGSAVCLADKTMIRPITDVFGNVQDPHYEVTFASIDEINSFGLEPGVKLFFPEHDALRQFALADELRKNRGTDASGEHDEEPDEMYFSDDEKEQEYNRMKKAAVKGRKSNNKKQMLPSSSKPHSVKPMFGPPRPTHMLPGGGRGDQMVSQVDTPSLDYGDSPAAARAGSDGYNVLRRPENYGSSDWHQPPKAGPPQAPVTYSHAVPHTQQPAYQQPIYQQPNHHLPIYQQQGYQQPTYQQPTYQPPTYQQPTLMAYPQAQFPQAGQQPSNNAYVPPLPPPPNLQDPAFLAFAQNQMGNGGGRGGHDGRGRGRGY